jgi:hypothetical protein
MPDETFLPETELRAYSYRGAYGQQVAGPHSNSMRPSGGALSGLAGGLADGHFGMLGIAGLALAAFGAYKVADASAEREPFGIWLGVMATGLFGAFGGAYYSSRPSRPSS